MVICRHAQSNKKFESHEPTFPSHVKQDVTLPSSFSLHTVIKYPFCGLFSATFLACWCFLSVISLFKMSPQLPPSPECKKAVMYLVENIGVLDKLHSGMSYSAVVGCMFNVNDSTIYIK